MGSPGDTDAPAAHPERGAPKRACIVYSGYVSLLDDGELGGEADAYLEKGDDEEPWWR